jgi:hypothetical protein
MDEFIRAQVRELKRTPNVRLPRPAECMIVTKLAPRSLAAHAGVGVKDLLVSLDGQPAASLAPQTCALPAPEHRWVFYSRPRHELIELRATGIEPGVELQHTTDAIKERYQPGKSSPAELEALWEARDWAALEKLSAATLAAYGRDRDTPALLFRGAALFETGRRAEGAKLVDEYVTSYAPHWTMNFTGIGYYYQALGRLERGEREAGLGLLNKAFEYDRCPRLADAVEKHAGTRPPLEDPRWLGREFPARYRLPRLEARDQLVGLDLALAAIGEGEVLGVCLLANYRGNGPYDDFMRRYHNYATWFSRFFRGLHVLTVEPERYPDRPQYFRGEDQVRADRLPLELLLEDGLVTAAVQQTTSPFVVLLDRQRRVRYEGELASIDLWNTMAAMSAPTPV